MSTAGYEEFGNLVVCGMDGPLEATTPLGDLRLDLHDLLNSIFPHQYEKKRGFKRELDLVLVNWYRKHNSKISNTGDAPVSRVASLGPPEVLRY